VKQQQRPRVYLDETGFEPSTHRLYGRAPKGQRVHGLRNAQQKPRTRLIGAYRDGKLIAPMLFPGTCNTVLFNQWLKRMLLPILAVGSVIILDNASFHSSPQTRQIIEEAGCDVLYLAPYSPDLNPIEKLWANIKRRWRNSGGALDELIGAYW
jgi:transposase